MRINFRVDRIDGGHAGISLFVNGGKAGDIILRVEELEFLKDYATDASKTGDLLLQINDRNRVYERQI